MSDLPKEMPDREVNGDDVAKSKNAGKRLSGMVSKKEKRAKSDDCASEKLRLKTHSNELDVEGSKEEVPENINSDVAPASPRCGPLIYMVALASCAALNSTNVGFDIGVSAGVAVALKEAWQLTDVQVGLFLGSIQFVAAIGALCSDRVSDRLGRRRTFTVAQIVLVTGLLVCITAGSFAVIMVGRFFLGIGVGLSMAIGPLYIAEVSPSSKRGCFSAWPEVATNFGIMLGYCVNLLCSTTGVAGDHDVWRVMIAAGLVMPVLLVVISMTVMPESPRWLVANGRHQEAEYILRRTHPAGEDVHAVVEGIRREMDAAAKGDPVSWKSMLCPSKDVAKMLLIGVGIAVAQQLNGSESIVAYAPVIFERAGMAGRSESEDLFAATVLVGTVKASFVLVAALKADSWGRRPLLLISTSSMTVALTVLALSSLPTFACGWLSVLSVCCFMATFSIGVGPMTWLMAAEAFTSPYRAKGMSLATFANRFTSGLVALTFLPLSQALGGQAQYFAVYACLTLGTAIWMIRVAPETKGQTLEEIHEKVGMKDFMDQDAEEPAPGSRF